MSCLLLSRLTLTTLTLTTLLPLAVPSAGYAQTSQKLNSSELIQVNYVQGLKDMTAALVQITAHHLQGLGQLFDAAHMQDTQQLYQTLRAEAHKDYHPSEGMCRVGSFTRSLAASAHHARAIQLSLNTRLHHDMTAHEGALTSQGYTTDLSARITHFKSAYCDAGDHNGQLSMMCQHDEGVGAIEATRINADIDYTRRFALPLTLEIDFTQPLEDLSDAVLKGTEDAYMMARHLYWSSGSAVLDSNSLEDAQYAYAYNRSLIAANNLAQATYTRQAGEKARFAQHQGEDHGAAFMKALLVELGVPEEAIDADLGEAPSYYAQMDVLTKRLYQHPDFYTNLYDKPGNVERIDVAMEAIQLMQLRDYYASKQQQEMLLSAILSQKLQ